MIEAAEAAARRGAWVVGWLAYEAAAFDSALSTHAPDGLLAWFGVHDAPLASVGMQPGGDVARATWAEAPCARADFDAALAELMQAIEAGEVYQVNHTARWISSTACA